MTTSNNEWPFRLVLLFRIREESTIKHPKENSLNLKEDLEEKRNIELRAEGSAQEETLTVKAGTAEAVVCRFS